VSVRVKKNPAVAMEIASAVIAAPTTPEFTKQNARKWKESIAAWQAEPEHKTNTEEGLYLEMKRILQQARDSQKYPADRSAEVLYLRTTALAHDLLTEFPNGSHKAEALLIAGLSYEILSDPIMWPMHEIYFETCIRTAPHSTIAGECFRHFEESIFVGWSGSGGTFIPDEVQARMNELKALAAEK
jgi:hypothetical protein